MKERILFLLNNLLRFDATVVKTFFSVASVRYEKDYNGEITELLQHAERYPLFLKDKSKSKLIAELKILDTENLRHFIDHQDLPPAYQEYLQTLLSESFSPRLNSPTPQLNLCEQTMFSDLFARQFDETKESLEGLQLDVLRIILQEWLLFPQLVCNKSAANELLTILECSNIVL